MKINLRAVELGDAERIYEWENTYELWEQSSTRSPFSRFAIENYVMNAQNDDIFSVKQMRLMIDMQEEGEVVTVGCVDIYDLEPQHSRAGIGIFIAKGEFRRRNIAYTSLEMVWKYAKDILNIHQLYAYVSQDNIPSINLFEKAGYKKTIILKDWLKKGGTYHDVLVFQKISNQ